MDYIGSKEKLNDWIFGIIKKSNPNYESLIFLDACSGSGSVSRYAVNEGFKKVIANDLMKFPSVIALGSISITEKEMEKAKEEILKINKIKGKKGFFYNNYSEQSGKIYFSDENAKLIDAYREYIESVKNTNIKNYLLYCLLESMSSVSNTTGVQAAFLKKLKDRALKKMTFKEMPNLKKPEKIEAYTFDILKLLKDKNFRSKINEDILYIDPPYNERQYGPNYHLYETLIKNDKPIIKGKTGLRDWINESKSEFCSKKTWIDFTLGILNNTKAKVVYISYNSDGLLSLDEIMDLVKNKFQKNTDVEVYTKEYKRYKSDSNSDRSYNESKLFELLIEIKILNK